MITFLSIISENVKVKMDEQLLEKVEAKPQSLLRIPIFCFILSTRFCCHFWVDGAANPLNSNCGLHYSIFP